MANWRAIGGDQNRPQRTTTAVAGVEAVKNTTAVGARIISRDSSAGLAANLVTRRQFVRNNTDHNKRHNQREKVL